MHPKCYLTHAEPKRTWAPLASCRRSSSPNRVAYSRRQAAESLGVRISTIDPRLSPPCTPSRRPGANR